VSNLLEPPNPKKMANFVALQKMKNR